MQGVLREGRSCTGRPGTDTHQADTNVKTTHGRTVLHWATESKHEAVVRLLLTPFLKQPM
jgi:ankyrin repeat protein